MNTSFEMASASTLRDIHFATTYWLYTKAITKAEASKAIKKRMDTIVKTAINDEAIDSVDKEMLELYGAVIKTEASKATTIKPVFNLMSDFLANVDVAKIFRSFVNPEYNTTNVWVYSNVPEYFLKHPISVLETKIVDSFDAIEFESHSLYLCIPEFVENCTLSGHIKSPIEVRFTAPQYDTKKKNEVQRLLYSLEVFMSDIKKVSLKNNIQEWGFTINPNKEDDLGTAASLRVKEQLAEIVEDRSTGKAYLICLENQPITAKGFKTQADVQKFLDEIESDIFSLSSEKAPLHIYLDTTLHLMSVQNAKGDTLPLTKFRFNLKKK